MLEDLSHYEKLAEEIFEADVLDGLEPEERRVLGLIIYRTVDKLKAALHQERIEKAKARKTRLGRPRRTLDIQRAKGLHAEGMGIRKLARLFGCGVGTMYDRLKDCDRFL